MSRPLSILASLLFAIALFTWGGPALAESEVKAHADPEIVEVGDAVRYTLEASSDSDTPSDPRIGTASGFNVTGPTISSTQSMSIMNGAVSQKRGISATWLLRATREGTFNVGPASVRINGDKRAAQPIQIKVVGKGKAPKRPQRLDPLDPFGQMGQMGLPFDPFGGGPDPFKGFFDDFRKQVDPNVVTADPRLSLDAPRNASAFLHATVDKANAVVGEQVTLTILLYTSLEDGDASLNDGHEAPLADFLKKPLVDVNKQSVAGYALIQGHPWLVRQIRKTALFPLKTGTLETGKMSLMLKGGRAAGIRESESLKVNVTEPPVKGRPHGYTIGDVGNFSITADVAPREMENGGAIAVTLDLKGSGNLPSQIQPPTSERAEWLEPTVSEKLGPMAGDRFGGSRTFTYVVRVKKEGDLNLGEIRIPFWNPDSRSYGIARAQLGSVTVKPGADPVAANDAKAVEMLPGLPAPLDPSTQIEKHGAYITDSRIFWGAWVFPPFLFAFASSISMARARWSARKREHSISPQKDLADKRAALESISSGGDSREIVAATIRYLEQAALVHAGIQIRGLVSSERQEALESASIFSEDAARYSHILDRAEQYRFSPEAPDLSTVKEAASEARALVDRIAKTAKPRPSKGPAK